MSTHYNAFISYRHHPEDMQAADQIHKALERYRLPRDLKKSTGGIQRLFRDKEELPITSNLSDDIDAALKNSDFLIVICSVHTKESTWVQREIDLFLTTHDRNHVLTVLINGEPYDVIPTCLLRETLRDPVTGEEREVPLEPLSCDWRSKSRKIRRQELDRLAAPLLGCSYDGLRQRQKHYQAQRRMAAISVVLAVTLCFLGYFLYSNHLLGQANQEITRNYNQALKQQSAVMASAAQDLLRSGDRLRAMALSMKALPEYPEQRPYVVEAEEALTDAAGIYQIDAAPSAVTAFPLESSIHSMKLSRDGGILFVLGRNGKLYCWDTSTFQQLGILDEDRAYYAYEPTRSGNLVIWNESLQWVRCYDAQLQELWVRSFQGKMAFLEESQQLLIFDDQEETAPVLTLWDADTAAPAGPPKVLTGDFPEEVSWNLEDFSYPSLRSVVLAARSPEAEGRVYYLLDPEKAVLTKVPLPLYRIFLTADGPDNSLLVLWEDSENYEDSYFNGLLNGIFTTGPSHRTLSCLDLHTMEVRWETGIHSDFQSDQDTLARIPDSPNYFCMNGNQCYVLNSEDGSILSQAEAPGTPRAVRIDPNGAFIATENGWSTLFDYALGECISQRFTTDSLKGCVIGKGIFSFSPAEKQVTLYRMQKNREPEICETDIPQILDFRTFGNLLLGRSWDGLFLLDTENRKILWQNPELGSAIDIIDVSEDQTCLWLYEGILDKLHRLDFLTGEQTDIPLPEYIDGKFVIYSGSALLHQDHLLQMCHIESGDYEFLPFLLKLDLNTGEIKTISLGAADMDLLGQVLLADSDHALLYLMEQQRIYEVCFSENTCRCILENVTSPPCLSRPEGYGDYCISLPQQLQVRKWGQAPELTISQPHVTFVSAAAYNGELLLLGDDAVLYRYQADGTLLSHQVIYVYEHFHSRLQDGNQQIRWYFTEDHRLVLRTFDSACLIHCEEWKPYAFVPHVAEYFPERDAFLLSYKNGRDFEYAFLKRYSLEELQEYAKKQMGDVALSSRILEKYGLSETP